MQFHDSDYHHLGVRVETKSDSQAYDHELGMQSQIDKGQTGVIKAFYWEENENELQVIVTWDPMKSIPQFESHTKFVDLKLRYKCD